MSGLTVRVIPGPTMTPDPDRRGCRREWFRNGTTLPSALPPGMQDKGKAMAKKKEVVDRYGRCGTCMERFDRVEAAKCAREGRALIHQCGRVLVRAR